MRKHGLTLRALAMLTIGAFFPGLFAQGPSGSWVTDIYCQNLSLTSAASLTFTFYAENNATPVYTYADPTALPAGQSRQYWTPSAFAGLPSPFTGSAVVTSDQSVGCTVNPQKVAVGTQLDPYRLGSYSGVAPEGSGPTVYVSQVERNYWNWNSYMAVQNTESASTAVTITYKYRDGTDRPLATETFTIPAQSVKIFYQNSNANLGDGFVGAAKIAANDGVSKLAVAVSFYNNGADSNNSQYHGYNGSPTGANKVFIPRFLRNYYGYNSGISFQNIGAAATTVTMTFYARNGSSYAFTTPSIPAGSAYSIYAANIVEYAGVDVLAMSQRTGYGVAQAAVGGTIICNVNEDNRGIASQNDGNPVPTERISQGITYNAPPDGSQTTNLFFPEVANNVSSLFSGGIQISNTTSTAGTCNINFPSASASNIANMALPANGSIVIYAPNVGIQYGSVTLPSGFNGSAAVDCTQSVIGIGNFAVAVGTGKYGDSYVQYNAINK